MGVFAQVDQHRLVERRQPSAPTAGPCSRREWPKRMTTALLRTTHSSLSALVPASAAWNSCWPARLTSTVIRREAKLHQVKAEGQRRLVVEGGELQTLFLRQEVVEEIPGR